MPSYYNVLTTTVVVASSSSGCYAFGIKARYVTIQNLAATPIWAKVDGCSTEGSTSDIIVSACENCRVVSLQFGDNWSYASGVSIVTTSTTNVPQFSIFASDGGRMSG